METNLSLVSVLESIYVFEFTSTGFILIVLWYVCACVYVCVCVYILPPWRLLPTARCPRHTWEVRINDLVLWIFIWVLLPISFISISENVIFYLQRQKLQLRNILERKRYDIVTASEKMIYIDIGYKSDTNQNLQVMIRY